MLKLNQINKVIWVLDIDDMTRTSGETVEQPPMDTLIGSSCPAPNASKESAKERSPS